MNQIARAEDILAKIAPGTELGKREKRVIAQAETLQGLVHIYFEKDGEVLDNMVTAFVNMFVALLVANLSVTDEGAKNRATAVSGLIEGLRQSKTRT